MGNSNYKPEILLEHSVLLKEEADKEKLKKIFEDDKNDEANKVIVDFKLLFQARKDVPQNFYSKCNKKAPIVILLKARESEEVFGFYLGIEIETPTKYTEFKRKDLQCFFFSLNSQKRYEMKNKENLIIQFFSEENTNFMAIGNDFVLHKQYLDKKLNSAILKREFLIDQDNDLNLANTTNNDKFTVEDMEAISVIYLLSEKNEFYIE